MSWPLDMSMQALCVNSGSLFFWLSSTSGKILSKVEEIDFLGQGGPPRFTLAVRWTVIGPYKKRQTHLNFLERTPCVLCEFHMLELELQVRFWYPAICSERQL